mmetsp:Transcript_24398/g.43289  ORF Transcript_24398/g.43289 Transcript_24398/m.43289 type:complete len:210 (+) Transcript_24398:50-679(+)
MTLRYSEGMRIALGLALLLAPGSAIQKIQFTGHTQATYADSLGHDIVLVWGGYDIVNKFLHYDINEQVDGLYNEYLTFNQEVYSLNLSNPSVGWTQIQITSGNKPPGRILHSMSMTTDNTAFTIFGGTQCFRTSEMLFGYALQDVWKFSILNNTWENVVSQGEYPDPFQQCANLQGGTSSTNKLPVAFTILGVLLAVLLIGAGSAWFFC